MSIEPNCLGSFKKCITYPYLKKKEIEKDALKDYLKYISKIVLNYFLFVKIVIHLFLFRPFLFVNHATLLNVLDMYSLWSTCITLRIADLDRLSYKTWITRYYTSNSSFLTWYHFLSTSFNHTIES